MATLRPGKVHVQRISEERERRLFSLIKRNSGRRCNNYKHIYTVGASKFMSTLIKDQTGPNITVSDFNTLLSSKY